MTTPEIFITGSVAIAVISFACGWLFAGDTAVNWQVRYHLAESQIASLRLQMERMKPRRGKGGRFVKVRS